MRLTFLGKNTQGGGSPTLYATDRDTYLVQGWKVADAGPDVVEIPEALLAHLIPGTRLAAPLEATGRQWQGDGGACGTVTLTGVPVRDPAILAQLKLPGHEACIEVAQRRVD